MKQTHTLLISLFVILALAGCSESPNNLFQGYVEGEYVHISSPISGTLANLSVQRGQQINEDTLLFTLERDFEQAAVNEAKYGLQNAQDNLANLEKGQRPSEIASIQAQLRQAKASAALARIEYQRREKLIEEHTISQEELDRAQSDYAQKNQKVREISAQLTTARLGARSDEVRAATAQVLQAEAQLDQALWNFNQKTKSAPVSGLVFDTLYRQGEWVPAGKPVISLLPPANIEVRFFVPESVVGALRIGQTTNVSFDGLSSPIEANIYYISPEAEYTPPVIYSSESRAKLVFMIKAKPLPKDATTFHPGQPVDVVVPDLAP